MNDIDEQIKIEIHSTRTKLIQAIIRDMDDVVESANKLKDSNDKDIQNMVCCAMFVKGLHLDGTLESLLIS